MSGRVITLLRSSLLLAPLALLPAVACNSGGGGSGNPLANAMLACGLLTAGQLPSASSSTDPYDMCMVQCIASSTCAELEALFCGGGNFEMGEVCQAQCIASNGFDCGGGVKILPVWHCDGSADCANGSDELDCPAPFVCGDGSELPPNWKCDGEPDCQDGSDEVGCPVAPTFMCTSGEPIPAEWRCDFEADCTDGSDEAGCASLVCPGSDTSGAMTASTSAGTSDTGGLETSTSL